MSWLPKRDKLDPVQASAYPPTGGRFAKQSRQSGIDFAVAQEGNFYIKGEAGTGRGEWVSD